MERVGGFVCQSIFYPVKSNNNEKWNGTETLAYKNRQSLSLKAMNFSQKKQVIAPSLSPKMTNMSFCCAFLVVTLHVGMPEEGTGGICWFFFHFLCDVLGRVAVPFFFLASGFFLAGHMSEAGWYGREMKKRARSLLCPYVLWQALYAVYLIPLAVGANLVSRREWNWNIHISDVVHVFGLDFTHNPGIPFFWFLRWLICLCVASPLLYWLLRKGRFWVVLAAYGFAVLKNMGVFGFQPDGWWWPWKWILHPFGTFYFLSGMAWRMGTFPQCMPCFKQIVLWLGSGWLTAKTILLVACGFSLPGIGGWFLPIQYFPGHDEFLYPAILYAVWRFIPAGKWPTWLTDASFGMYAGHAFFTHFIDSIMWFSRLGMSSWQMFMFKWLVSLAGTIGGVALARKHVPTVARFLLGGR